jgi:hypothetical protein
MACDRLIAWARQQPKHATGFADEVWWSQIIVGWVQDALTHMTGWNSSQPYERLLAAFEKENKRS